MARSSKGVAAIIAAAMLSAQAAMAGPIEVDTGDYAKLPAEQQDQLVAKMKEQGLLADDDTVKSLAPAPDASAKESFGPAVLLTLVPAACKIIATAKKHDELGKCAAKTEAEAQAKCSSAVESKFTTIETVCNAIRLF